MIQNIDLIKTDVMHPLEKPIIIDFRSSNKIFTSATIESIMIIKSTMHSTKCKDDSTGGLVFTNTRLFTFIHIDTITKWIL